MNSGRREKNNFRSKERKMESYTRKRFSLLLACRQIGCLETGSRPVYLAHAAPRRRGGKRHHSSLEDGKTNGATATTDIERARPPACPRQRRKWQEETNQNTMAAVPATATTEIINLSMVTTAIAVSS
jgi:hypothetical protein